MSGVLTEKFSSSQLQNDLTFNHDTTIVGSAVVPGISDHPFVFRNASICRLIFCAIIYIKFVILLFRLLQFIPRQLVATNSSAKLPVVWNFIYRGSRYPLILHPDINNNSSTRGWTMSFFILSSRVGKDK